MKIVSATKKLLNDEDASSGESMFPVDLSDNLDGTYCARFTPNAPGSYDIETKVWGHGIVDDLGPVDVYGMCIYYVNMHFLHAKVCVILFCLPPGRPSLSLASFFSISVSLSLFALVCPRVSLFVLM